MLLIDIKGRIRGVYNATQVVNLERVSDDINILLKENNNKIYLKKINIPIH
jgi:protein SCO1/2